MPALKDAIDELLLVGYGKEREGDRVCGLKDLFDVLKNFVVTATIFVGCLSMIISPANFPGGQFLATLAALATLPLLALGLALIRQIFLILDRFPTSSAPINPWIRFATLALCALLLAGLVAVGATGLLKLTSS